MEKGNEKHEAIGKHLLLDLAECDSFILNDLSALMYIMKVASFKARAKVVGKRFKIFYPQGISLVLLLAESHLSIHTYPELGVAFVDFFTCGDVSNPELSIKYIIRELHAKRFEKRIIERSIK
jgi:S-adenosylmethionine decarboxylase proenzyme